MSEKIRNADGPMPGDTWRSNDRRDSREIFIRGIVNQFDAPPYALCENIATGRVTRIRLDRFKNGVRGYTFVTRSMPGQKVVA